jgi:TatA/E family protein of Tat protein translocase
MFDIGLQEMLVIGVIALLIFGPAKLPELGRMVGRAMREFRRASDEFRSTVETNLHMNDFDPTPSAETTEPASTPGETVAGDAGSSAAREGLSSDYEPVADAQALATTPPDSAEPFCAQRGSHLFHRRECGWVTRIPEAERLYWKRVSEARDQGFVTCPVCEPWEPA